MINIYFQVTLKNKKNKKTYITKSKTRTSDFMLSYKIAGPKLQCIYKKGLSCSHYQAQSNSNLRKWHSFPPIVLNFSHSPSSS